MPRCDLLLTNATIVTMDERFTVHPDGGVAIAGDSIVSVGPDALGYDAVERHDCGGRIVLPGLVNAHTHVPMSLLRGLADDLRLDVWLMGYMMPVEREFVSPEFVRLGTRLGCAEMIRSGITCFADMYYFEDAVAEATADVGMRALCGQTVLRFPAPDARSYEEGLARAREFIERWKGHPLIVPAPAPHAPYTCTPEILRSCAELAAEFDVPLHIHLSETLLEVEESRSRHGMPGVPYMRKQGLFDAKVLAAHCVHVDEGEIRALKNFGAGVAHNPEQQPEAGRRHRPGHEDARARRQRRHRHRRRGVEQRPRHVRRDAAGRAAGQGHHRRSDRGAGPRPRWRWRRGSARRRCTSAT